YRKGAASIVLVASGALGTLYTEALGLAGLAVRAVDADEAVRAGLIEAARKNGMIAGSGVAA
ncbi:MAG: 2-dehydro-3-deoxygalactonokinase, partial [Mesorhizobium sp.]